MEGQRERDRIEKLIPSVLLAGPQVCRGLLGTVRSGFHVSGRLRTSLAIGSALSIGRQESHKSSCLWVFGGMKRRRTNEKRGMTSLKEKRDCRLDLCKLALGACSSHQTAF